MAAQGAADSVRESWTQTSRACTPVDVLITRPYVEEDSSHLPVIHAIQVSVTTSKPPTDKLTAAQTTPSQTLLEEEISQLKGKKPKQIECQNEVKKVLTDTTKIQGRAFVSEDKLDPVIVGEHPTTPISMASPNSDKILQSDLPESKPVSDMKTGDAASGLCLPVAQVKRDTMLTKKLKNKHSIADLNALRNKFINFDQYRLNKRKNEGVNKLHFDTDMKPQLSIGDWDEPMSRKSTAIVKSTELDPKSGKRLYSSESKWKEMRLSRSKTYAGPSGFGETSPQDPATWDLLCEVKGLRKESPQMNRNTPHAELLSPNDTNPMGLAKHNKYFSNPGPPPNKIVGSGVNVNTLRKPVKSPGKHLKQKKESSKLILKFYSDDNSRARDSLKLLHDATFYDPKYSQTDGTKKVISDAKVDTENHRRGLATIHEHPESHPDRPVSLTTRNLEIFDHMTNNNEKKKSDQASEESDSDVKTRVLDWLVQGKLFAQDPANLAFQQSVNKPAISVVP